MKTIVTTSKTLKVLFFATLVILSSFKATYAKSGSRSNENTTISMAREAVSKSPNDWFTLAESASKLIDENANMEEANAWINKSLELKQTAFNLEVMGKYYKANNDTEKATEYYLKSMSKIYMDEE